MPIDKLPGRERSAPTPAGERSTLSIRPLAASARFSLRLRPFSAANIRQLDSFQLDQPLNTCVVTNGCTSARLGPDEWLLLAPLEMSDAILRETQAALGTRVHSLVDVSDRNVGIAVAGSHAREVLHAGCPLDLDDAAFPAGSATRTVLGKAEIILLRAGVERAYRVECWRSFAPYVEAFLKDAGHGAAVEHT